ncbi:flocculation protein FLO11-like isoform X2 [Neodiprion fabricii]|uniref:flocculation protein FLO11-like isoform X2 n=1 Tax=Neodiprion fabricii TaxID=2872261 RepID=UPI001ED92826|nr:flocculation protein FLO11-like isoform X2 [Neodiprion fabricii]
MRKIKGSTASFCVLLFTILWLDGTLAAPSYCAQWLAPYVNSNPSSLASTDSSVIEKQKLLNQAKFLLNQLSSSSPTYSYNVPSIGAASPSVDTSTNRARDDQVAVLFQNLITQLGTINSNSVSVANHPSASLAISDVTINALTIQYNNVKGLVSSSMNRRSARVVNTALDALYKTITNIVTGQLRNAELPNLCSKAIVLNRELEATDAPSNVTDAVTDWITSLTLALTGQSQISLLAICSTLNDLETSVVTVVQNDNSEKLQYLLSNLVEAVVKAVVSGGGSGCDIIDVVRQNVAIVKQAIQEDANVRAGNIYNSIINFEEELYNVLIQTDPTAVVVSSQSLPFDTADLETLESEYLVDISQLAKSIFGDNTKLVKLAIQIFLNLAKSENSSAGDVPTSSDPSKTTLSTLQKVDDLLKSVNESSQTNPVGAVEMLIAMLSNTPQDDVSIILGALDPAPSDTSNPVPLYDATVIVSNGENFIIKEQVLELKDSCGNVLKSVRSGTYKFTDPNTKISWSGSYGVQNMTVDSDDDGITVYERSGVCTTYLPQATSDLSTAPRIKRRAHYTVRETVVTGTSDDGSPTVNDIGTYTLTDPVTGAFVSGTFVVENSIFKLNADGSKEIIKSGVLAVQDSDSTSSSDVLSTLGSGDYSLISYHIFNESDYNGNLGTAVIEITDPETGKYESGTAVIQQMTSITNPDGSDDTTTTAILYVDGDEDAVGENVVFKEHTTYVMNPLGQTSPVTTGKFNRTNPTTGVTISDTYVVQNIITINHLDGSTDITKFDKLSSNILATMSSGLSTITSGSSTTTNSSSTTSSGLPISTSEWPTTTSTSSTITSGSSTTTNTSATTTIDSPTTTSSSPTDTSGSSTTTNSSSTTSSGLPISTSEWPTTTSSSPTITSGSSTTTNSSATTTIDSSTTTIDSPITTSSSPTDTSGSSTTTNSSATTTIDSLTTTSSSPTITSGSSTTTNSSSTTSSGLPISTSEWPTTTSTSSTITSGSSTTTNTSAITTIDSPTTTSSSPTDTSGSSTTTNSSATTTIDSLTTTSSSPTITSGSSTTTNSSSTTSSGLPISTSEWPTTTSSSPTITSGSSTTTNSSATTTIDSSTTTSSSPTITSDSSTTTNNSSTTSSGLPISTSEWPTTTSTSSTITSGSSTTTNTSATTTIDSPTTTSSSPTDTSGSSTTTNSSATTTIDSPTTASSSPTITSGSSTTTNSSSTTSSSLPISTSEWSTTTSSSPTITSGSSTTTNSSATTTIDSPTTTSGSPTITSEWPTTTSSSPDITSGSYNTTNSSSTTSSGSPISTSEWHTTTSGSPTITSSSSTTTYSSSIDNRIGSAADNSTTSLATLIKTINLLVNILNPENSVTQSSSTNNSGRVASGNVPASSSVPIANSLTSTNDSTVHGVDPTTIIIDGAAFMLDQHMVPQLDSEGNVVNVTKTGRFSFTDPVTNVFWSGNVEVNDYSATSSSPGEIDVVESGTFTVNLPNDAFCLTTNISDPANFEIHDNVSVTVDDSGASIVTEDGTYTLTNPKTGNSVTGNFVVETSVSKYNSDGSTDTIKSGIMYVTKFCTISLVEEPSPLSNGGYFLFDDHIFATPESNGLVGTGVYNIKDPNTNEYTAGTYLIQEASKTNNSDGSLNLKTAGLIYVNSSYTSTNSISTDSTLAIINGAQFVFDDHLIRVKSYSGELNTIGTGTLTQTDSASGTVRTGTYSIQSAKFKTNSDGSQDTIKSGTFRYTNNNNTISDLSLTLASLLSQLSSGLNSNSSSVKSQELISILKTVKTELSKISTASSISQTDRVLGSTYVRLPRSDVVSALNGQNLQSGDAVAIQTNNGDALLATIQDLCSHVTFHITNLADLAEGFANAKRIWTVHEDNFSKQDRTFIDALLVLSYAL